MRDEVPLPTHPRPVEDPTPGRASFAPDIEAALVALSRDEPRGVVDRTDEAGAIRALADRIESLLADDPEPLRRELGGLYALARAIAGRYAIRAANAPSAPSSAAYAAVALRGLGTAAKIAALIGATASPPEKDAR